MIKFSSDIEDQKPFEEGGVTWYPADGEKLLKVIKIIEEKALPEDYVNKEAIEIFKKEIPKTLKKKKESKKV